MYTNAKASSSLEERAVVPLFPLPGAVFLPHTLLPLHVFEQRYRDLIEDVHQDDGLLAIPRLKPGWEANYGGNPPLFRVAGFGKIVRCQVLPDGRSNIVILGLGRIRIEDELATDTAYRISTGDVQADIFPTGGINAVRMDVDRLRMMVAQTLGRRPQIAERIGHLIAEQNDPVAFINGVAHLVLPDVDARQRFLEMDHVRERIELLEDLLASALLDDGRSQ